jgi:hypothetical protein
MKLKILAILICTLFLLAAFQVTANNINIEKSKVSIAGSVQDEYLDIALTNAFSNELEIYLGNGDGGFTNYGDFPVGEFPAGITDGDFNSDGILDVVTTNYYNSTVSLMIGNGHGDFTTSGNYSVGTEPLGIKCEDFNSDGFLDVAIANAGSNYISVLLGDGIGGFSPEQTSLIGNGPVDICVGMFDGDDNLDIIGANLDDDSISVLLGDGNGGFILTDTIDLVTDYKPYAITKGDFNEDGNLDVACASGGFQYVGVLLGNGTGEFISFQNFTVGYGLERFDIVTEDFNKDDHLDIAVPNPDNNTISVLIGSGTGGFGPHQTYTVGEYPVGICDGDFNSDGNIDLAVTNAFDDTLSILIGDGTGGFEDQDIIQTGDGPVGIITGNINYIPEADLECDGTINWRKVKPGEQIIDEFSIANLGEEESILHWQIESYPTWGEWSFSDESGYIQDGIWESIQVFITAPNESKTEFTGIIKIINIDEPSDSCEIEVTVETPRTKNLFQTLLNFLIERFPNLFLILKEFLKI